MKTLYKRLKPKAKKAVDENAKSYPYIWQPIVTELKLVKFVHNLSVKSAVEVHSAFYPRKTFGLMEYYELFND